MRAAMPARPPRNVPTRPARAARFCLTDADVLTLADYAIRSRSIIRQRAGHAVPMDIEWAKDGIDGKLYIVQARPETVASQRSAGMFETFSSEGQRARSLVTGKAVGEKIAYRHRPA